MKRARLHTHAGQLWVNLEELRVALKDDDMVLRAAAMLKVSHEKGDAPLEILRRAMGFFLTEATGVLEKGDN